MVVGKSCENLSEHDYALINSQQLQLPVQGKGRRCSLVPGTSPQRATSRGWVLGEEVTVFNGVATGKLPKHQWTCCTQDHMVALEKEGKEGNYLLVKVSTAGIVS